MTASKTALAMHQAVKDQVFPAAELLVFGKGDLLHHGWYGEARQGICFDVASLTKPLCTATLTALFIAEELVKCSDTVYQWLGGARLPAHRIITVEMLLNHLAGLPAWQPYYQEIPLSLAGTEEAQRIILDACYHEPTIAPPGEQTLYSDIGFLLLGKILEEAGHNSLDALFANRIAQPLELHDTFFQRHVGASMNTRKVSTTTNRRFAPTEDCPWRGRVLHGEVHDQNAYALGGVAGHAGLFSTAGDIHRFLITLTDVYAGKNTWIQPNILQRLFAFDHPKQKSGERFLGGWNLPSRRNSASGRHFSPHSIGHLSYTGCSIWVDLDRHAWIILLTNRIHPHTTNEKIKAFRPNIHDLVMTELIL